jgi:hypothetical protein
MAINEKRPAISYENIAMLQSSAPAYSIESNSGQNVAFLPLVQSIEVSFDIPRNNAGEIGSKGFINQSFQNAPDVSLKINSYEDFSKLFENLFTGSFLNENLDFDRNFYAVLNDERGFDISKEDISGKQILSFGNCYLNGVTMSQSVNGLIQSSYDFVGSNLTAQEIKFNGTEYTGLNPALNLTGNQNADTIFKFEDLSGNYYTADGSVVPSYTTDVIISGSGSIGNFLINSESVQSFDLSIPINRKTIYTLGKKFPVKRKALFPSEGSFSFSNITENFHVNGERASLLDFVSYDEFYDIFVSGKKNNGDEFVHKIQEAKINSMSLSNSIGSNSENSFSFSFDISKIKSTLGITAMEMIRSVFEQEFTVPNGGTEEPNPSQLYGSGENLVIRQGVIKDFEGNEAVGQLENVYVRALSLPLSNHPDYPGDKYMKPKPRNDGVQGSALRLCFVRIRNGEPDAHRTLLGPTTNNKNLFNILIENNLLPTENGVYIFVFSFKGWVRSTPSELDGPKFIASDEEYSIFKIKLS